MEELLARCGFRCDLCLAYRPNVESNPGIQETLSDGWHEYFGFRIPPEKIVCDGCIAPDSDPIDDECPVRPCATARHFATCAQCSDYICDALATRLVVYEDVAARVGRPIPEEDRARFIAPYENKPRLEALRRTHGGSAGEA